MSSAKARFGTSLIAIVLAGPGCLGAAKTTGAGGGSGGSGTTGTPTPGETQLSTSCGKDYSPGHYALRRLTNTEYTNTVQDLVFTTKTPGATFTGASTGASGFTNDSTALTLTSPLVLQYYGAAEDLAAEVIASKGTAGGAYSKIATCTTTDSTCVTSVVTAFAKRAFRRPATSAELDATSGLVGVFNTGAKTSFDQGLSDFLVSVLLNPNFLMIPVVNDKSTDASAVFALDSYQLASRVSYDLWQTMPDDTLMQLADAGSLTDPTQLVAQVKRMLANATRTANLKNTLRDEYAGMGNLASLDFTTLGKTNELRTDMIGETDAFFTDLITNDRSPLDILTTDESFVNKELAAYYGVDFPAGTDGTTFVPVKTGRIGLGSQASVLMNTSGGEATETHPIKRGHWIADQLYCTPPPPPPTNQQQTTLVATTTGETVVQELAAHAQGACASCHVLMDSFGLAAEGFDPFGLPRTQYTDGSAVVTSGSFANGPSWTTPAQFYQDLSAQPKAVSCVAQQMMSYAYSRSLSGTDDSCVATNIGTQNVTASSSFSEFMSNVITSRQFMFQTGEAQ